MNIGGDSGRDDYGLPPVDIEIPDDARELDRDVHAYHRELRAQRRRMLAKRLCAPLSRDGMVLPLLAGCLALTLLAGTLLTVLTTGQGTVAPPSAQTTGSPGRTRPSPTPGAVGTLLPDRLVTVNGQQESLRQLAGGILVLALVPPGCRCLPGLQLLARRAGQAGATTYLVGTQAPQLYALSLQAGLGKSHAVIDSQHALPPLYRPPTLAAVLVRGDGTVVSITRNPVHDRRFLATLRSLGPASTRVLPRPGRPGRVAATLTAASG